MSDTTSTPKHTASSPMYPGRPLIWTDNDTNRVVIGTHDGDAVFALREHQVKAIIDMLNNALAYSVSQQTQDDYLYEFARAGAVSEFRKDYIERAGDDLDVAKLTEATEEFIYNYDREHGHN